MLQITKLLEDCDERFQLLLIGFHHVLDDHESKRSTMDLEKFDPLHTVFTRAKNNAKFVLCEIRTALQKLGVSPPVISPQHIKSSKKENQNLNFYDWVIFREYINQLEHIHGVMNAITQYIPA